MLQQFCHWVLKIQGWNIVGSPPDLKKYIVIVAPHTSNWDFIIGVLARKALNIPARYIGKHQLFRPPYGFIFRWLGGYPVVRTQSNNLVESIAEIFKKEKSFILALAPEGTRSKVEHIKEGFYHMARAAQVPVVAVGLDFKERKIVLDTPQVMTENKDLHLHYFLTFFRQMTGKYPELGL